MRFPNSKDIEMGSDAPVFNGSKGKDTMKAKFLRTNGKEDKKSMSKGDRPSFFTSRSYTLSKYFMTIEFIQITISSRTADTMKLVKKDRRAYRKCSIPKIETTHMKGIEEKVITFIKNIKVG